MNNNGHKCNFNAEIVSFLYGEADGGRQSAFDSHLPECSLCREEVAELSFVRAGVSDWKAAQFSGLAVPRVRIPIHETPAASLFDRLRALVMMPAGIASAAAVLLVAIIGLAWFASRGPAVEWTKVTDTPAAIEPGPNPDPPQTAPSVETTSYERGQKELAANKNIVRDDRKPSKRPVPKKRSVRNSSPPVSTVAENARTRRPEKAAGPDRALPTLTSFEEEADESLRLADLLSLADTDGTDE